MRIEFSHVMKDFWQREFYRYGWDTRSRNMLPARVLRQALAQENPRHRRPLLDVGCGYPGLASFLSDISVAGIDLDAPPMKTANVMFQLGSVTALPFGDRSFPVVSCIDVLEHLAMDDRQCAVRELVRVASRAVLIACPHGLIAQACDDEFRRASERHRRPTPDWVSEHLRQPYPSETAITEQVTSAAGETGRGVKVSLWYCEPTVVTRMVRAAAARSDLLYAGVNLLFGMILPLLPRPDAGNGYRMVLLAEFAEREKVIA